MTDHVEYVTKHLELIQNTISRMDSKSSNVKNYSVTITAAIIGFAATADNWKIIMLTTPAILVLAVLDGSYLRLERGFIAHYNSVRMLKHSEFPDFSLNPTWGQGESLIRTIFSWSIGNPPEN